MLPIPLPLIPLLDAPPARAAVAESLAVASMRRMKVDAVEEMGNIILHYEMVLV